MLHACFIISCMPYVLLVSLSLIQLLLLSSSPLAKQPFLSHSLPQKIPVIRLFPVICPESDHSVFTSVDFATTICLQSKAFSFPSNPQPGGPSPCIHVPQRQGGPLIPPGTGFYFLRLLRLAGQRWHYSILPPRGTNSITLIIKFSIFGDITSCSLLYPSRQNIS
jgi:hypothetical protein